MICRFAAVLICCISSTVAATAQSYPVRPVRIIAPFPPGGSTDVYARLIAKELSASLGQTFIIDNRPGGTGILGTLTARQATPDGYTLLFTSNTAHVIGPLLKQQRPFDPVGDFTPVTMAVRFPLYLIVNPAVPAKTVKEFVAYARAQPGRLNYASSGEGGLSHLCPLLFNAATGVTATHIPYKGAAPGLQAVVSGEAQYRFDNLGTSQPHVLSGRLRGLALTGTSRFAVAPEIPTLSELGIKGLEGMYVWLGLFAPPRLPPDLRDRLSTTMLRVLKAPDIAQKAAKDGYDIVASTPAQFGSDVKHEIATVERVIKDNALKTE